jgi:hypothetical protein
MNDALTTAEKIFVEHWATRRLQALRSWIVVGAIVWGGVMSSCLVYEDYAQGRSPDLVLLLRIAFFIAGGCLFGASVWALTEFRYRRMATRDGRASSPEALAGQPTGAQ